VNWRVVSLTSILLGTSAPSAHAEDSSPREIDAVLAEDAAASRRWYFGWTLGFAASTGGQLALLREVDDDRNRAVLRVGAFMSGVGFLTTVLLPPPSIFYDRPARLDAEKLRARLRRSAAAEDFGHSWIAHGLGIAANAGAGLYLALHYRLPWSGLLQFVVGTGVSTLKIALLPTVARDHLAKNPIRTSLTPLIGVGTIGLAIDGAF